MADAIFIVGYYRSGTSALSGALQRLGVKIFNEADPNEHNPLGFYEIPELIEFDVDLFHRLGVEWTDVRGLPHGWWERADMAGFLSRLEEIIRRRFTPEDAVWALKHPHLCRALPIYERAARQAGHQPHVLHIFRDPWTAAASQHHKNGLSRAHALLLWLSYVTSAERLARHLPRSWMTYPDLLTDPVAQLRRAEADTGIALGALLPGGMAAAAAYLNEQLNRSDSLGDEGLARPLRALVDRGWETIRARDFRAEVWDGISAETAELVGFLTEIGASRGKVIPAFGGAMTQAVTAAAQPGKLRPAERIDEGAKQRLLARAQGAVLPGIAVVIVAPPGRAHAINDTLEALSAQWRAPARVEIIAADEVAMADYPVLQVAAEPGAASRALCAALNRLAAGHDYVAVLNAGDRVAEDACLRFALAAAEQPAALIYCDEIVPREGGAWVRHKPAWDVTRLRQSAYIGDWAWYRGASLLAAGGFDARQAGAEEYGLQLRLAEAGAEVLRLPEALFTRHAQSRRDTIPAEEFCARAAEAVRAHLGRSGMPASVQNRQHLGLFHHARIAPDPGTTIILLCSGAEIPALDHWLTGLLRGAALSGPVILAGSGLSEPVARYLTSVTQQHAALEGKVLAVMPQAGLSEAQALGRALAMASTELVAVVEARAKPAQAHWAEALRARLADPGVALAGARALVPMGGESRAFTVQGPIVLGADTRLGAGHMEDDPGPGGWLIVDQEASAVAPPGLLARRALLAGCDIPELAGDALWVALCGQLRALGHRIVWTPDVSFHTPAEAIRPDGAAGTRAVADPYHHPALSLHGDLLAPEQRLGLVRAAPADARSLLVSGPPESGALVLNAARALRRTGALEADWAPEPLNAAELGRRAADAWVRVNPERAALPGSPAYRAVFCAAPVEAAAPAIAGAESLFGTSPEIVRQVRALAGPGRQVTLARPALSGTIWRDFSTGLGLNTRPRVLWVDEGNAPDWLPDLINETLSIAAWIVVERAGASYSGAVARFRRPDSELEWHGALAELGPQIFVRPAGESAEADDYLARIAAACGCHLLVDDRLDMQESLGAVRLANQFPAWEQAVQAAVKDLTGTLAQGKRARAAALALPMIEEAPPLWAQFGADALRSAAE